MTHTDPTNAADRWHHLAGARFVGPDEWRAGLPQDWAQTIPPMMYMTEALSDAADDNGQLIDFQPDTWYTSALADRMRDPDDEPGWTLRYDRFSAAVIAEIEATLHRCGYLATRGNGDSKDRRLTLPPEDNKPSPDDTRILRPGDVLAAGLDTDECVVGMVLAANHDGFRLDLCDWPGGKFNAGTRVVRFEQVREFSPLAQKTEDGMYDMSPLIEFTTMWTSPEVF